MSINEDQFYILQSTLKTCFQYCIIFLKVKNSGYGDFQFTVNDRPSGGSCSMFPESGVALKDKFKVTCANWFDTDSPLAYKFGEFFCPVFDLLNLFIFYFLFLTLLYTSLLLNLK